MNRATIGTFKPVHFLLILLLPLWLAACSDPDEEEPAEQAVPTTGQVLQTMFDNMGGLEALESVDNLILNGSGFRRHVGQIPETGGEDPVGQLPELTEVIDLANGRAAFDNDIVIGDFQQHRTEALTYYQGEQLAWGTTEGRPVQVTSVDGIFSWATHNTPEMLLRRNVVTIALAAALAPASQPAEEAQVDGETYWLVETTLDDEDISVYIDQDTGRLAGWRALDTETMWGDTETYYWVEDYRPVGDLMLPFSLEIVKDDGVYASIDYDSIQVNDDEALAIFDIPEEAVDQAEQVVAADGSWVPLEWNPVTDDVTHVVAFSHHSMVVEFPEFVVVVEAPYSEGQSLTTARLVEENIGKPIRYAAPTHPHYDHTGGIRAMASLGANILVAEGHEEELRMIVESPHTNPPDALAERINQGAEVGMIEVFSDMTEITGGDKTLALYEVYGIPHVSPMVLAHVPGDDVLFQSDLFFGGPSPDAQALYQAIQDLGLEVEQIVGGHGGVLPFSALAEAVTGDE